MRAANTGALMLLGAFSLGALASSASAVAPPQPVVIQPTAPAMAPLAAPPAAESDAAAAQKKSKAKPRLVAKKGKHGR